MKTKCKNSVHCFDNGELSKKVVNLSVGEVNLKEKGNGNILMLMIKSLKDMALRFSS